MMKLPVLSDWLKVIGFCGCLIAVYVAMTNSITRLETNDIARKEDIFAIKNQINTVQQNQVVSHSDLSGQMNALRTDIQRLYDYLLNKDHMKPAKYQQKDL